MIPANLRGVEVIGGDSPQVDADANCEMRHTLSLVDIHTMSARQEIEGCALVLRSDCAMDRSGQPYLLLTLRCGDGGRLEARWWRYPYPSDRRPKVGQVCWFRGCLDLYGGDQQLAVTLARPAPQVDVAVFARATRRSEEELRADLDTRIKALDPEIAALVAAVLSEDILDRFCRWPAAQQRHGAVRHGLLAHSLRVACIAERLSEAYGPNGLAHDRDVVIAALLLHDVGKVHTLPAVAGAPLPTGAAECDHVTRSVLMVQAAATRAQCRLPFERLARLTHAILGHHGRREWGAAVEPQTSDAWLVHLADLAESRLWDWSNEEAQP